MLFKFLILLWTGTRICGRCPSCTIDTNTCKFDVSDDPPECADICLESTPDISNSGIQPNASSFKVTIEYLARNDARAIITWALPDEVPLTSNFYNLEIVYHFTDPKKTWTVCLSLESTITKVDAELKFPPWDCPDGAYMDHLSVTLTTLEPWGQMKRSLPVHDCFETMAMRNQSVCGIKMPAAPESAKAVVIAQPPGQTVVKVSWKPAQDDVNIEKYFLRFRSNQTIVNIGIKPLVPGNTTEYTVTLNKTLSASDKEYVTVQAGIKRHSLQCGCCVRKKESGIYYEFGAHATATLQFPEHSSSNYVNLILWPLIGAAVALVLIVLLTFHCIKVIRKNANKNLPRWFPVPTPEPEMYTYEKDTVYLIASTEEDERMRARIRCLCRILGEHGLTPIYYEYVANDHDADGPLALGMNRWVELQFGRCEFVLFVCTKRFMEEWNGEIGRAHV